MGEGAEDINNNRSSFPTFLCRKYGIKKSDILYFVADNASVNPKAVELLHEMGYNNMEFVRCLPHCLNLVIKAFMDVVDKEILLSSNLKLTRAFLNAGGGSALKIEAASWAVSQSTIDIVDTRWSSLVSAAVALAHPPKPGTLEEATSLLQEAADAGDETAAEALKDKTPPGHLFGILYDFIESISEEQLAERAKRSARQDVEGAMDVDVNLPATRLRLLTFYSDRVVLALLHVLNYVFGGNAEDGIEKLTTVTKLVQGGSAFEAKLSSKSTGVVPNAVASVRALMLFLKTHDAAQPGIKAELRASRKAKTERMMTDVRTHMGASCKKLIADSKARDESILDGNKKFNQAEADKFEKEMADSYVKDVEPKVLKIFNAALAAARTSPGLEKLEEAVAGLEEAQRFSYNEEPKAFEDEDDSALMDWIGIKGMPYTVTEDLIAGWRAHCERWTPPKTPPEAKRVRLSPRESFLRWRTIGQQGTPEDRAIASHAMDKSSRPTSAASCERVFSHLEHMSSSDRSRMKKNTLINLLFIRGNAWILRQLMEEQAAMRKQDAKKSAARRRDAPKSEAELLASPSNKRKLGE